MNAIKHVHGRTRVKTKKLRAPRIKDRNPPALDSLPSRIAENLRINDPLAVGIEELADPLW